MSTKTSSKKRSREASPHSGSKSGAPSDTTDTAHRNLDWYARASLMCSALSVSLSAFNLDHREQDSALPVAHAGIWVKVNYPDPDDEIDDSIHIWTRALMVFRLNPEIREHGYHKRWLEVLVPLYEKTTQDFPSDGIAEHLATALMTSKPVRPSFKRGQKRVYRELDKDESVERIQDAFRELEWQLGDRGYKDAYWVDGVKSQRELLKAKILPWLDTVEEPYEEDSDMWDPIVESFREAYDE